MDLNINKSKRAKIEEVLKKAQGKSTTRIFEFEELEHLAQAAEKKLEELKISKINREGCVQEFMYRKPDKKYPAKASYVRIKRGKSFWKVVEVDRRWAYDNLLDRLLLSNKARDQKFLEINRMSLNPKYN